MILFQVGLKLMNHMDIPLEREILDTLPFGVTIQTLDFKMSFQNKFSREIFGSGENDLCYTRWKEYEDYGDEMCKDCMSQITTIDKQSHSIVRRMTKENGEAIIVKIFHQPMLNEDGDFDQFIEMIFDITKDERVKLIGLKNYQEIMNEIYIFGTLFGDSGGDYFQIDDFPGIDDTYSLALRLSQFWFMAIGQGDTWKDGIFGPLPVLDLNDYDSLGYAFRLYNEDLQDERHSKQDVGLLIVCGRRENTELFNQRTAIREVIDKIIKSMNNVKELKEIHYTDLKREILFRVKEAAEKSISLDI